MSDQFEILAEDATLTMPGVLRQVTNFGTSAGKVVDALIAGEDVLVSGEERLARISFCATNICGQFNSNGRCFECGCLVEVKAALETEMCPFGHW